MIEEYLAKTFPALTEAQLIEATRNLEPVKFLPGAVILQQGAAPDKFFIITRGRVEVVLPEANGQEIVATTMVKGQYFGEVELRRGGHNIATIRADPVLGVEVAAFERAEFESLLAASTAVHDAIDRTVSERIAENEAARSRLERNHA
ncbi:MAG: cyclic nucleotide-binding domain-containing protein [Anaerolineae bacterium]|nr:cyclic nucleotide-binding domain-containing protein [Anaerolineae bacterium]